MNTDVPITCPICGGDLEVDEEYMYKHYGAAYTYMPWREWSFYCVGECEEAGLWSEFEHAAQKEA